MTAAEERLLASAPRRWRQRLSERELIAQILLGIGFVVACVALIGGLGDGGLPPLGPAIALTVAMAALSRVEFQAGSGYTAPIQLAFVPMLFVVPAVWAPVLAGMALTLGLLPPVLSGQVHVSRLLTGPANAWFAVGPATVFAVADIGALELADTPIYLLALAAQFLVDYAVGAVGERISLGVTPKVQLRVMGPIWLADLLLSPIGMLAAIATEHADYAFLLVLSLGGLMASYAREHQARIDQAIELSSAYRNTALVLGDVIGHDDAYTGAHSLSVLQIALDVARELKLDDDELRLVEFGALLHDVGKIAVPKEIINKPGPLTDLELEIMRTHTLVGQQMLDRVGGALREVGEVVRSSHERVDGTGYPDGKAKEEIPLASRIVGAVDAFSAMTTDRPYRKAMSAEEALRRLRVGAGSQFDPDVVAILTAVVERRAEPETSSRHRLAVLA